MSRHHTQPWRHQRPTGPAITASGLVKAYPGGRGRPPVRALDGLTIDVPVGTVFGLLGPNGAGKSTTVKILTTLARADSGSAEVAGVDVARDPAAVRRMVGLVGQKPSTDPMGTGRENLRLAARIHGLRGSALTRRVDELLARFALGDAADRLVRTYSGGMARKLDVALGIVHRPPVLFLDEPTTGLDPQARAEMWAEIARMADDEEVSVLLTTHYLDEADRLAHRVAIVEHGTVVVEGTPDDLKSRLRGDSVQVTLADPAWTGPAAAVLRRVEGLGSVTVAGDTVHARTEVGGRVVVRVMSALESEGVEVAAVTVARPSLDEVYLRHAGRRFGEVA